MPQDYAQTGEELVDGRYRLLGLLGQGGMAQVYRAFDLKMERPVALKVMRPEFARNQELFRRFVKEARLVAQLDNEHVVRVYDWGSSPDGTRCYLAMEYVAGRSLDQIIAAQGALTPCMAADVAWQAADALVASHARGIIHSDIKPGNLMFCPSGKVKVTDFGIARVRSQGVGTAQGAVGTLQFMSPEQMEGHPPDVASDVFSLGVTLYQLCCGFPPYACPERPDAQLLRRWLAHPHRPSALVPQVGAHGDRIVLTAMEADPSRRFASALAMRVALESYLECARAVDEAGLLGPGNPLTWGLSFVTRTGELGHTYALTRPVTIGSGAQADFCIGSTSLAAVHACVAPYGCLLRVENQGPRGSLLVNGQPYEQAFCVAGDTIRMGETCLMVGCSQERQPLNLP